VSKPSEQPLQNGKTYLERAVDDGILEGEEGGPAHVHTHRYTQLRYSDLIATKKKIGPRTKRRVRTTCVSRAGVERDAHDLDRDGHCIFCDQAGRGLEG
jgi:hypothetical protein